MISVASVSTLFEQCSDNGTLSNDKVKRHVQQINDLCDSLPRTFGSGEAANQAWIMAGGRLEDGYPAAMARLIELGCASDRIMSSCLLGNLAATGMTQFVVKPRLTPQG